MTLMRDREGIVAENPRGYREGDRFRLYVTSPFVETTPVEIVVFQEGDAFFPYPPERETAKGNRVSIPGAFSLTGEEPAILCVLLSTDLPERAELKDTGLAALPETAVCHILNPVTAVGIED